MAEISSAARGWPADVIHVNEDGWVLINRGRTADVIPGMRLLVVGSGTRELRDLFAPGTGDGTEAPLVLRLRRTYELLEVVYVEDGCAIAVAARAPVARRPQFYRGADGELLVWVPLPDSYSWPPAGGEDGPEAGADGSDDETASDLATRGDNAASDADDSGDDSEDDPPGTYAQEDHRWEEALPLNSVSVGDLVLPALPATSATSATLATSAMTALPAGDATRTAPTVAGIALSGPTASATAPAHPAWDKHYDWMGPKPEGGGS